MQGESTPRRPPREFVNASELAQMGVCEKQVCLAHRLGPRKSQRQELASARGTERHESFHQDALANAGVQSSEPARGPCFIATAVFGETHQTQILRAFRDEYLAKAAMGRIGIQVYYLLAPGIAKILKRGARRRIVVRSILRWLVRWIEKLLLSKAG